MATIEKRKGKYRVKIRRKNSSPLTATFHRLADAKKWAQTTEAAIIEERFFPGTEAKRYTVSEMIDRYVDEVLPHKRPSTTYNQIYQLRWWKSQLDHKLIADITPNMIAEYRSQLAQDRSHATVNRYLAVLSDSTK